MILEYIVPKTLSAMPARVFLQKKMHFSSTQWKKLRASHSFKQNGALVNPARTIISPGDILTFEYLPPTTAALPPADLPLQICYEDDWLLIVNKPARQLVHPTVKENKCTLANAVLGYYQRNGTEYAFHPVHRLDRATSGLLLIAKVPQIQYALSNHNALQRWYLAILTGKISPLNGSITAPIARKNGSIIERCVSPDGQSAITNYKTLKILGDYSLVEIRLQTGRTHQIRVHFASINHPLLGDDLYGGDCSLMKRQALHSSHMRFLHPVTQEIIDLSTPLPLDMKTFIDNICN